MLGSDCKWLEQLVGIVFVAGKQMLILLLLFSIDPVMCRLGIHPAELLFLLRLMTRGEHALAKPFVYCNMLFMLPFLRRLFYDGLLVVSVVYV